MVQTLAVPEPTSGSDSADVQAISDWLIGRGLTSSDFAETLTGFSERLASVGVPLMRGMMSMRTLHPTIDGVSFIWRPDGGTESANMPVGVVDSDIWLRSPINHMISHDVHHLRRPLVGQGVEMDFPLLDDLKADGATDYYARLVPFDIEPSGSLNAGMYSSWVTADPAGFSDAHITLLDRLIPRLALSVNANLTKQIAVNVLDTYVGPDAGRRIMGGEIHRSEMRVIRAVVLYTDLRGFTTVTDTLPGPDLIDLLDAYFDRIVPPITGHGGQILKFLGDGLLATFELDDGPRDSVCREALTAATEAAALVAELNASRARDGLPAMALDIALHLGDVFYGNIGAAERLDFTVIGPAVNEASRIEALCGALDRPILVSETFAAAATQCTERLVPLGRHKLRGVRELQDIYGVISPEV